MFNGAILQQSFVAEYIVEDHMCDQCARAAANPDQWTAVVQLRQKVDHKRTFFFLEQLILKHTADVSTINIKQMHDGVDFFYANKSHAQRFIEFISAVVPVQYRSDKQLVSQDSKSNTYIYKFTFSVEICPICKDDLICLPQKLSTSLGNLGPVVLCNRVSNSLLLMDPNNLRVAHLDSDKYWRYPFKRLMAAKQLVEYVVLDIEIRGAAGQPQVKVGGKNVILADAAVARVTDFGKNDIQFTARTHLGHLLSPGDFAMGYDIYGANLNDDELDRYSGLALPDVVLVKKSYEEKRKKKRGKPRPWKLKQLPMEVEDGAQGKGEEERRMAEYERFMEEIEEDPELRAKIAVYKDDKYVKEVREEDVMTEDGGEGDDPPEIPIEELLMDLKLGRDDDEEDHMET